MRFHGSEMRELGCGKLVVVAAALEHEDAFALATAFGLAIDLRPESPEVIDGRKQRHGDHEPDGRHGDHVHRENVAADRSPVVPAVREDDSDDGDDLHDHLEFAYVGGLDREAFLCGDRAQAGDEEFTSDDDDGDPGGDDLGRVLHERDVGSGDQELVGQGVEQHAESRDLLTFAGEVAVESVGDRGEDEHSRCQQFLLTVAAIEDMARQDPDEQRHGENACRRDGIWQVHQPKYAPTDEEEQNDNFDFRFQIFDGKPLPFEDSETGV